MDLAFLAHADAVTLKLEKAKRALESAKAEVDSAKQAYDDMLAEAEERGIPKAKLKRLTEERVNALFDIGMIDWMKGPASPAKEAKDPRPKKAKKSQAAESVDDVATIDNSNGGEWDESSADHDAGHA